MNNWYEYRIKHFAIQNALVQTYDPIPSNRNSHEWKKRDSKMLVFNINSKTPPKLVSIFKPSVEWNISDNF